MVADLTQVTLLSLLKKKVKINKNVILAVDAQCEWSEFEYLL